MILIMLGAPGAGKGTQAKMLAEKYKIPHISTGDMFRAIAEENSALGRQVKQLLTSGTLVSDETTIAVVKERLNRKDCKNGFILDGFPRTIPQAETLDILFKELKLKCNAVLNFTVDEEIVIERLSDRWMCKCGAVYHSTNNAPKKKGICNKCGSKLYQRSDDKEETARKRVEVYLKQTSPLIEYYKKRNLLITIDADRPIEVIFKDTVKNLK